jgi:predicted nuclease of predicted toxin-antitoxin system
MKLCCDENIKRSIVQILSQEGHDVVRVQDRLELGFSDSEIIAFCRESDRVLLTNDDDFFRFNTHPGILFLVDQQTSPRVVVTAIGCIERYVPEIAGHVWHVPDGWV